MNPFSLWFGTGLTHILDPTGYDHILFVCLLAISYSPSEWQKLLMLITAFTVGHCVTLALSVITRLDLPGGAIEFSIALSILIAALFNLTGAPLAKNRTTLLYTITFMFGLLHGLGFSFLLRSLLGAGQNIILPLLYFNLGIEVGQVIIVVAVFLISLFLTSTIHLSFKRFKFITVCIITLIALKISADRFILLLG